MEPVRVQVVDAVNAKRVLGTLPRPAAAIGRGVWSWAVSPMIRIPLEPAVWSDAPVNIKIIHTELAWVSDDDGWTKRAVLCTNAPLDDLVMIREFRLPGESEEHAAYRRGCW